MKTLREQVDAGDIKIPLSDADIDSFDNNSKYSELAFSLGSAKNNSSSNFDFEFA